MTALRSCALAALCLIAAGGPFVAGEVAHTVQPGDSVSAIAEHYYGDVESAELLLQFNRRERSLIRAGETLQVPYGEVHRIAAGDTWSGLSKRYLGKASVYPVVARLNGLAPDAPLRVGAEIMFPVTFEHPLAAGESLAVLAGRYDGDPLRSDWLLAFNELDDPRRLSVGTTVLVPVLSPRLQRLEPPTPDPAPAPVSPTIKSFEVELRQARQAYLNGEFDDCRAVLESIRDGVESDADRRERADYWELLSFVYVAFDDVGKACSAYRSLPEPPRFDPDRVSPKIREILAGCPPRDS